tara:strand:- start:33 stop:932 length:900 start_codon:yes stop_codon:yes gene_type:complete
MKITKPIILVGTGRSGTSVITDILVRHKDLAYPSIYNDVFYKYPKINLIRNIFDNSFWRIFGEKNQLNKVSFFNKYVFRHSEPYKMWEFLTEEDTDFSRNYLLNKKAHQKTVEKFQTYFSKMLKYQNRSRLIFKLTGAPRMCYLLSIFPDAQFVVFKRKFIPTLSSILKVDFWQKKGLKDIWIRGAYSKKELDLAESLKTNPVLITALQLKKMNEILNKELEELEPPNIIIQYENFVSNPSSTIREILSFLELSEDDSCLDFFKSKDIINRNKENKSYFNENELDAIKKIFDFDKELRS